MAMKNEKIYITTIKPDMDLAVMIGKAIRAQKPLPPSAQRHVEQATILRNEGEKLEDKGDWLGAAEKLVDATAQYGEALSLTPPSDATRIEYLFHRTSGIVKALIDQELSEYSQDKEYQDVLDIIEESEPGKFAKFAYVFSHFMGWQEVLKKIQRFLEIPLTGLTKEDALKEKKKLYESGLKGTAHHVDTAQVLGPELVVEFEKRHHAREGRGRPGQVDIVARGNIAVECKNYSSKDTTPQTVEEWIKQAKSRLDTDIDTGRAYRETIIVIPDEADYAKTKKLFDEQIQQGGQKSVLNKIKLWTLSMLKRQKQQGYFG